MSTNSKQHTPSQEEIDLLSLFIRFGDFLKRSFLGLIKVLGFILIFLLKKWYYLLIALALTSVSAIILEKISIPVYVTDMIMKSNVSNNQSIMPSVNVLGDYASEGNYTALSEELNIEIETAKSVKGIKTYWYYDIGEDGIYDGIDVDERYLSDTSIEKVDDEFVLRMEISNPIHITEIEKGIINYLESNPFLSALNQQRLLELEASIKQTEYEIIKLDSLQKREYYTNTDELRQKEGQLVFTLEKIVNTYHDDMFRLLRLKQNYERELGIYNKIVTVKQGFSIPNTKKNGIFQYFKKILWLYLGLSLLIALIITYRKKIRSLFNS